MCNALCIGWHHSTFIVQIVVLPVRTHHSQDRDTLTDFYAKFATGSLVAFHFIDKRMFGKFPFQRFTTDAIHWFTNRINPFLLQYVSHFLFGDETCIDGIFDNQFHVIAHLSGRLPVESRESYHQIGDDEQ